MVQLYDADRKTRRSEDCVLHELGTPEVRGARRQNRGEHGGEACDQGHGSHCRRAV